MNESDIISSRRKFLKNMAYGSLLMVGGIDVVNARARHHIAPHAHASHKTHVHDMLHHHLSSKKSLHRIDAYTNLAQNSPSHKVLALHNTHTGDRLKLTYFERGNYVEDALLEINHLFRDYHDGSVHPIDPALLDQLYDLKHSLEVRKPFNIVSGYRSPATNADLRRHSDGVAKNSLHMQGRAIDIRLEGIDTKRIRNAALALRRGGVGYYPRSNFVHLDTGSVRSWGS
ncbi:YcbK family protein [Methylobacter svalbardensis]|uniref:YcbK family protein n=1 Tax=Methylobacter svalbardensis TaxID=3080016 RepID=UPI0030EB4BD8